MEVTPISGFGKALTTNPPISVRFEYDYVREGSYVYFVFDVIIEPNSGTAFPYNLKSEIEFYNTNYTGNYTIKSESPSRWSSNIRCRFPATGTSAAAKTGYKVDLRNTGGKGITFRAKIYSSQASGSGEYIGYMDCPADNTGSLENVKIKVGGEWKSAEKVYIKNGGAWKEAEKVYIKAGGVWKEV